MPRIRLLLLDANIVLELHRLGLWRGVVDRCGVLLARTVIDESRYFEADDGQQQQIDLEPDITAGRVRVVDVPTSTVQAFLRRFTSTFADRLDPGELESLAHLVEVDRECRISSADAVVWRTLGTLRLSEQGISLEEILDTIGLTRRVGSRFSRHSRERETNRGFGEGFRGESSR